MEFNSINLYKLLELLSRNLNVGIKTVDLVTADNFFPFVS